MIVHRIYIDNSLRNFNYLLVSEKTGQALCVDPLDAGLLYEAARQNGWQITGIFNTHEHHDHVGGNLKLKELTKAKVYASALMFKKIPGADIKLGAPMRLDLGQDLKFNVIHTPGHTLDHVSLFSEYEEPALFCGDTIFHSGAGNCYHGGDASLLFETFHGILNDIPAETMIYPGHDYLETNLKFALSLNEANHEAEKLLQRCGELGFTHEYKATILQEKVYNPFFRCLHGDHDHAKSKFIALREKRNHW